ncbi:MAG: hypothetical protein CMD96_05880 [Gammaproteobacteria bacterium]|nr:hypothetical protein [Gammaproteobacteria bacterium]|tara:strand:+ start:56 stop:238 length:183 start_codon:yes stop_codon:yes gene_type:complete
MFKKVIKIEAYGESETDLENAIIEATHRIKNQNTSGFDENDCSSFSFNVEKEHIYNDKYS